jgi:membrane associated rhomboid family serine protease
MIPISDENPTLRTPVMTYLLLALMLATWVVVEGAGTNATQLAAAVCNYGLVPAELTHGRPVGFSIPIGPNLACQIDDSAINVLTPLLSMFLHGSWGHLLGNAIYFWVFGNNVEDSMGRFRFLVFYLVCGLAAAATQLSARPARSPAFSARISYFTHASALGISSSCSSCGFPPGWRSCGGSRPRC